MSGGGAESNASLVIAVDGPSGSGKSSVSKGVAQGLGLRYLDTGAMYRAAAWWMLEHGVDLSDAAAIAGQAAALSVESGTDPDNPMIWVSGVDVSEPIRTGVVTGAVSAVSAVPQIRAKLVALQREQVLAACERGPGIVVEGRDIGTVVLPNADLKIFLVADQGARAQRRAAQDEQEGRADDVASTADSLAARDAADSSRQASPLTQASDAHLVDATYLTLPEVIDQVLAMVTMVAAGTAVPAGESVQLGKVR